MSNSHQLSDNDHNDFLNGPHLTELSDDGDQDEEDFLDDEDEDEDEFLEEDEEDESDTDPDPPAFRLPSWFHPTLFMERSAKPSDPDLPIYDLRCDLIDIAQTLADTGDQMLSMLPAPTNSISANAYLDFTEQYLRKTTRDLRSLDSPAHDDRNLQLREDYLLKISNDMFTKAENDLVREEAACLESNDKKLHGHASRYERSRYRCAAKSVFAGLRTARLRERFSVPTTAQPDPTSRDHKDEPICAICHEDLQEEGMPATTPAVTYTCCKTPYHVDCLLEYMFGKAAQAAVNGINCPFCRGQLDGDFFGAVSELKVRTTKCL